jgi:hypothetical protein
MKKLLSLFPLSKYGVCPLSLAYSMVKNLITIEKSQLIIYIYFNNIKKLLNIIYVFLKKYIIIIVITKILTLFFTFCYSLVLPYLIIFQNNFYKYCLSLPLIAIYYYDPYHIAHLEINKTINSFIGKFLFSIPSLESITSIFNIEENIDSISDFLRRERNMDDIENNIAEITNSADRSFLLFFLNFFKKKEIIVDSERQPLLTSKSNNSISSSWVDIEDEERKELLMKNNNNSWINSSKESSENNSLSENDSNFGDILQTIEGPFSLNEDISNLDESLIISDSYKRKKRKKKINLNKDLPSIPLEKEIEELDKLEQWEKEIRNPFNPDDDNQIKLEIIRKRLEMEEDNLERDSVDSLISKLEKTESDYNSNFRNRDSIDSLISKLERITTSDIDF